MPLNMVIPVGSGSVAGTGIDTFSGLVTSAGDWLDRSDLTTKIPLGIQMVEERLSRILRVPEMEEIETLSVTSGTADLPTDFREVRHLYVNGDIDSEIVPTSLSTIRRDYGISSDTGRPLVYAIQGGQIHFGPSPDTTYSVDLYYYQDIPALSTDNETNWLISKHPSIYLFGTLMHMEFFGWNDERLPLIKSAWDEAIGELQGQGNSKRHGGGPLFPRPLNRPMGRS